MLCANLTRQDQGLQRRTSFSCCGLLPGRESRASFASPSRSCLLGSKSTRSIPYFNLLWASVSKVDLTIHYARPTSSSPTSSVRVAYLHYALDLSSTAAFTAASAWISKLLEHAYGSSQRKKRIKLLVNPYGGAGKAVKICQTEIEPILAAAHCELDIERTSYRGHAVEIAEKLDISAYDVVAAASGDGLVHEVFNGLGKKSNAAEALRQVAVVQLPCGTGNAMSWNLNGTDEPSLAALYIVKGLRMPFDLMSVSQGDKRTLSFLSQSIGIVAESDLGTENLRWMGDARFTYGFLVRLIGKTQYSCDIAVKAVTENKSEIKRHYAREVAKRRRIAQHRSRDTSSPSSATPSSTALPPLRHGTVSTPLSTSTPTSSIASSTAPAWSPLAPYPNLGSFYAGNMCYMAEETPFFPASCPNDGQIDIAITRGDVNALSAIKLLLAVPKNTFFDEPGVEAKKVLAFRVVPRFGKHAPASSAAMGTRQPLMKRMLNKLGGRSGGTSEADGGCFSVDGEKFPFEPFQVEIHRALGTVLSRSGYCFEATGPQGWEEYLPGEGEALLSGDDDDDDEDGDDDAVLATDGADGRGALDNRADRDRADRPAAVEAVGATPTEIVAATQQ